MTTETSIPEQTISSRDLTWLEEELSKTQTPNGDRLPSMKFEENKIADIEIDFGKPFQKYNQTNDKGVQVVKAIVPLTHEGQKKNWWLNTKNPAYHELCKAGKAGQTKFKILQTGNQQNTKYVFVK